MSHSVLEKRMLLKRSFDSDATASIDTLSCSEMLASPTAKLRRKISGHFQHLGKGRYGNAYRLNGECNGEPVNVVAKLVERDNYALGSAASPFRAEHVEPRMMRLLWEHIVESGQSPHLVAPFNRHITLNGGSTFFLMEHAGERDLRKYLRRDKTTILDNLLRVVIFQVCYTLHAIHNVFPNFCHNDLSDANVFITPSVGSVSYSVDDELSFVLPDVGVSAVLGDFDFAAIPGILDNNKVLEASFANPEWNIHAHRNQACDIYYFLKCLVQVHGRRMSPSMRMELRRLYIVPDWPAKMRNPLNSFTEHNCYNRVPWHMSRNFPTAGDILRSHLFAPFRAPATATYSTRPVEKTPLPEPWSPLTHRLRRRMLRNVPCLRIAGAPLLPTQEFYFAQPATRSATKGAENGELSDAYKRLLREQFVEAHEQQGYEKGAFSSVWALTDERASFIIGATRVKAYWWPALYTCAFVDAIRETGVFADSWTIQDWTVFWGGYGKTQLLYIALQWSWLRQL